MEKLRNKIDSAIIGAKCRLVEKREGRDIKTVQLYESSSYDGIEIFLNDETKLCNTGYLGFNPQGMIKILSEAKTEKK